MESLYVVGGQRKKDAFSMEEWHRFQKGLILRIDLHTGTSEICVEYVTPAAACASKDEPSILFKAGTVREKKLYVCTQTEVLVYELPSFRQIGYISLPYFNDLHHVCPTSEGNLLVAISGLDMVVELTQDGKVLREWNVLGEEPWERFSRDIDYRKVVTTKPHRSHPNYVSQIGKDIWVTRFEQRDAICLTQPDRRIEIGIERPHDGIIYEGSVYYTTVDGHIIIANLEGGRIERHIDLNAIGKVDHIALGWCRGLKVIDNDHIIVGFSRLRSTKWRENVRWVKRHFGVYAGALPTRIALYNLSSSQLCWEKILEDENLEAVFSIHTSEE